MDILNLAKGDRSLMEFGKRKERNMEGGIYFVFFSKEQKEEQKNQGFRPTFAKLKDGSTVEYTELCQNEKPSSLFNDFVLLGKGDFDHIGTSKDTVPREKFKPKSPKNILKKRPYGYF